MSYRIVLRDADSSLLYSNGYDNENAALCGAQAWIKNEDLELLRIAAALSEWDGATSAPVD